MSLVVFTGPTLPAEEARKLADATYLPPASFGSVYRAAQTRPLAIAIIDGFFDGQPAVWHKEILWALSQGIHVFGSSSMGALRAAELSLFGMVGVGKIAALFSSGHLESDDEVALAHGHAECGYRPLSVPLVDIRFTLRSAERAEIIDRATKDALLAVAKSLHYRERNYSRVLREARRLGLDSSEFARFEDWLPTGQVHQKRIDAVSMLRYLEAWSKTSPPPKQVSFAFSHTDAWEAARERMLTQDDGEVSSREDNRLLNELCLSGKYREVWQQAMARTLGVHACSSLGRVADLDAMGRALDALRAELCIPNDAAFADWLQKQSLPKEGLASFARNEAAVRWAELLFDSGARAQIEDVLRIKGWHETLTHRVIEKERSLRPMPPTPSPGSVEAQELLSWYFERHLGHPVPKDIKVYARTHGFGSAENLLAALAGERAACDKGLGPAACS